MLRRVIPGRRWAKMLVAALVALLVLVVVASASAYQSLNENAEHAQAAAAAQLTAAAAAYEAAQGCGSTGGGGGSGGESPSGGELPADLSLERALAAIRKIESGSYEGNYTADSGVGTPGHDRATGAYQFLDSTWSNYEGYRQAKLAPPEVQDAKARQYARARLEALDGPWERAIPLGWFLGTGGAAPFMDMSWDDPQWDVPQDYFGTTARDYVRMFREAYADAPEGSGRADASGRNGDDTDDQDGGDGCGTSAMAGEYALPIDRDLYERDGRVLLENGEPDPTRETGDWFAKPHHDYPAADIPVPEGTDVFAVVSGRVVGVTREPDVCGLGLTIEDDEGVRYVYCHAQALRVELNEEVRAGQPIMDSGNTGNSTGPHLHLGIKTEEELPSGLVIWVSRCPQKLLLGIYDGDPVDPATLPTDGCFYVDSSSQPL